MKTAGVFIMHLSLAFSGVDPRDTHGEPPRTRGEWYIFDNFLGARGGDIVWFWKRTLQTPGMHPRDLVAIGQRYMVFKIPDEQLAAICIPFLGSVARLFFIMPLYKAWDVLRRKRKSVIADSFDEFVVKGELNSISSDFVVSEHTFLILKRACARFNIKL